MNVNVQYCNIVLFSTQMSIDVDLLEEGFSLEEEEEAPAPAPAPTPAPLPEPYLRALWFDFAARKPAKVAAAELVARMEGRRDHGRTRGRGSSLRS